MKKPRHSGFFEQHVNPVTYTSQPEENLIKLSYGYQPIYCLHGKDKKILTFYNGGMDLTKNSIRIDFVNAVNSISH